MQHSQGEQAPLRTLSIRLEPTPFGALVRLLVDGKDVLAATGNDEPNVASDILATGAMLPVDPPRRVALYGCGCGIFGCANVAVLISQQGNTVSWSDAMSVTGEYGSALHGDFEQVPDPVALLGDNAFLAHDLHLPTISFAADQYLAEVNRATAEAKALG